LTAAAEQINNSEGKDTAQKQGYFFRSESTDQHVCINTGL